MTRAIPVSVVIVSRGRPAALRRCLMGVSQQAYPLFEIVAVTDRSGAAMLRQMPLSAHVRHVRHDEPNISAARNAGIAEAAGEVVAFIDDDAVPEPSWLTHLAATFDEPEVTAATGFVRGRNGISWQWRARAVDMEGREEEVEVDPTDPTLLTPAADMAIRTQGTNMAFRRDWLAATGGFDPAYRFFLDETDVNLRLASQGRSTAIVPLAQVHHGYAANALRRADRVPTDLFEIGASWAVFLSRHCPEDRREAAWRRIEAEQRARALRHMQTGAIEPRDVRRLMASLDRGFQEGLTRSVPDRPPLPAPENPLRPFPGRDAPRSIVIAGRAWSRARLRRQSAEAVAAGRIVTQIRLSPTALRHRVRFTDAGYWEQVGGLFGKSLRSDPPFAFYTFNRRVRREVERVKLVRLLD